MLTLLKLKLNKYNKDAGFTLIELLVVIAIIGILAGIAVPIFLNQQEAASHATVQSDAHNTATSVTTYLAQNPTITAFPDSVKVITKNNVVSINGNTYDYRVCAQDPAYPNYTYGFDSTTGLFGSGCDITGATSNPTTPPVDNGGVLPTTCVPTTVSSYRTAQSAAGNRFDAVYNTVKTNGTLGGALVGLARLWMNKSYLVTTENNTVDLNTAILTRAAFTLPGDVVVKNSAGEVLDMVNGTPLASGKSGENFSATEYTFTVENYWNTFNANTQTYQYNLVETGTVKITVFSPSTCA